MTEEDIKQYLDPNFPRHALYEETVKIANELQVHSNGRFPTELLDFDRPGEEPRYKEYRLNKIDKGSPTKGAWGKISTTTDKIKLAEDWAIKWTEAIGAIAKGESLQDYTEKNFPLFDSLINWFFTLGKKKMEEDPNGVIAIYPLRERKSQTDLQQPFTFIYDSDCIIDYEEGKFCAILCREKSLVTVNKEQKREGNIFLFFDTTTFIKAKQVGDVSKPTYQFTTIEHKIEYMPVFKFGGIVKDVEDGTILYDSFYAPAVRAFNEAVCRYSDHQVNMVRNVHPKEYGLATAPCRVCNGSQYVQERNFKGVVEKVPCKSCYGLGRTEVQTPWQKIVINPVSKVGAGNNDVAGISGPPGGYIERPIDAITFVKQEYKDKIQEGYDALNLGFINQVPLDQSGIAKGYDRQEMNAFFSTIAEHIINNILNPCYYFISKWRYGYLNEDTIIANLPQIKVPTKFDIALSDILVQRVKTAVEGKFNPVLINALQIQYAEKELGKDHEAVKKLKATFALDPLPNLTIAEKNEIMVNSSSPGTDYRNYVLSINLPGFIERAIAEDEMFLDKDYEEQIQILGKYVDKITVQESKVVPMVDNNGLVSGQTSTAVA